MGRYQAARKELEDALSLLPESGLIAHALARLLAAVPDLEVRDGARALQLAQLVFQAQPSSRHAETLAQAHAEAGQCSQAAEWQRKVLEALASSVDPETLQAKQEVLSAYEAGPPCRPPV